MISITDVESGVACILENLGRVPHYAFVSRNSLMNIFNSAQSDYFGTGFHGLSAFGVYTSFGLIMLSAMSSMKDDEIAFSQESNLLIDFINKIDIRP